MSIHDYYYRAIVKSLRKEQRSIAKRIDLVQSWLKEEKKAKRDNKLTRAHSERMKKVWAEKRKREKK